ncbi:MAG TPA: prolipoprotein diacylglyceryl transferase family protein, partial [Anaerolineaceae bacterium]|nr:prolipoprotein diacylglyceryl transferase family protein [Anaerolineaceae bacterium]
MFPILNVGPLAIQTPGLLILIGIYLSMLVVEKQSKYFKINPNDLSNLIFIYLASSLIIARIAYFSRFPALLADNPLSIISLNPNLFDFGSGLLLSILIVLIFIQKKKLNLTEILDSLVLPLMIFLLFYFLAQFSSGNLFGKPAILPWAVYLWGTFRHPLQIYYVLGLLFILVFTLKHLGNQTVPGFLFLRSFALLSFLTVFLDFFNGNPQNTIGNVNIIQIIAWFILLFC